MPLSVTSQFKKSARGREVLMKGTLANNGRITDLELIERTRGGDRTAFDDLVKRHWRKCVDVACYYLRNRTDAEDQAQNAVLKAYEHLDQFQGDAEFATWLARIVSNQCLMLMRVRRRARFVYLDEQPVEHTKPLQLPGPEPNPETTLADTQMTEVMRFEVGRIPRLMRNVMLLRDIQGLPMNDVANQLGITVSAAKSRLVRARAELRTRMSRHYSRIRALDPADQHGSAYSQAGRYRSVHFARTAIAGNIMPALSK